MDRRARIAEAFTVTVLIPTAEMLDVITPRSLVLRVRPTPERVEIMLTPGGLDGIMCAKDAYIGAVE